MSISQLQLGKHDLFALRRWWIGLEPHLEFVNPVVAKLVTTLSSKNAEHLKVVQELFMGQMADIAATDPNTPPPPPYTPANTDFVPRLPSDAELTDKALAAAEQSSPWFKATLSWATRRSPMTPPHFLEAGIVWLLGLAVNRRVCLSLHEQIYPTLYVLIVAETSKYAKSTGLKALDSIVDASMPHMLIPGSTTTEGMMEIMSGGLPSNYDKLNRRDQERIEKGRKFAGQRGILLDEYSSLLGAARKDYMQGFIELLMRLYDNKAAETHYTRGGGMIVVHYPALSIMGATTPAAMARALNHEQWENGAMARYLIMFRDKPMQFDPDYYPYQPPDDVTKPLAELHTSLPALRDNDFDDTPFTPLWAVITKEAHEAYQAYLKAVFYDLIDEDLDERLHGNYRRMHMQAMKIAVGLACMDWLQAGSSGAVTVELGHWALAQQLAEKSRASLHRLMPVLSQTSDTRTRKTIISVLRHFPGGLTLTEIGDKVGRQNNEIRSAVELLVEAGQVEVLEVKPTTGRPTLQYRLVSASISRNSEL